VRYYYHVDHTDGTPVRAFITPPSPALAGTHRSSSSSSSSPTNPPPPVHCLYLNAALLGALGEEDRVSVVLQELARMGGGVGSLKWLSCFQMLAVEWNLGLRNEGMSEAWVPIY
jgi:hypothetical protein